MGPWRKFGFALLYPFWITLSNPSTFITFSPFFCPIIFNHQNVFDPSVRLEYKAEWGTAIWPLDTSPHGLYFCRMACYSFHC